MKTDTELLENLSEAELYQVAFLLDSGRHSVRSAVEAMNNRKLLEAALENPSEELEEEEEEDE